MAVVLGKLRLMRLPDYKPRSPLVVRPFVPPTFTNRFLEWLPLALGAISLSGIAALSLYVAVPVHLPQALWASLPC